MNEPAEPQEQSPPSMALVLAMPVSLAITVLALLFGLLVTVGYDEGGEATPTTTAPAQNEGAELFASLNCGGCHTLSAAGATGTVGPNLDETQLSTEEIEAVVETGRGAMPAFGDQLEPAELQALAEYVSGSG